jgi:chemotaxis protein MotB
MARMHKWLGLAVLGLSLTGCVSSEQYNAMKLRADQLAEQESTAEAAAKTAQAQADAYKQQLDQIAAAGGTSTAMIQNLNSQLTAQSAEFAEIKAKYEDLLKNPPQVIQVSGGSALPAPLTNALSEFANANPDIVDFDAARGVVKFKSDVTFAPGSAEVNPKAKEVLARFVAILDSPAANGYELMVAGHTDNTPIVREETKRQGHFDNWYLSCHRAIAVAAELVANGVSKSRLGVAGYADQHPIASNSSEAGKAQNRRVEVLILPTTAHGSLGSSAGTASAHVHPREELNKDSGSSAATDQKPILNK